MSLNGLAFHREGPLNGYPLKYESHDRHKRRYGGDKGGFVIS
jgi:hypothetical protein